MPACKAKVAWVWRESCRRTVGSIDSLTALRKERVTVSGSRAAPIKNGLRRGVR
jgi:hypothetical protein